MRLTLVRRSKGDSGESSSVVVEIGSKNEIGSWGT